ncbi:sensor histidine kinase [Micrococcaceae bacterium RIT802]|nr:sensor histidine kinase [Micrococcaceae bacterium RIT 802]
MPQNRRRFTLSGQFLALQLLIVLAVLVGVLFISLAQSERTFERMESRRALSAAETLAAMPIVRSLLPDAAPKLGSSLPAAAESVRSVSGASLAQLALGDGTIVASSDPGQLGESLQLGRSDVMDGRAWTGSVTANSLRTLVAHVPVLDDSGKLVGVAVIGRTYPSLWERLGGTVPNLLIYLGVSLAVGTVGSLLLSRRVKHQTLGMEPDEIAGLVEHREAILHGVKEGVVAIDPRDRITLVNDAALELLGWPAHSEGLPLDDLGISDALRAALTRGPAQMDQLLLVGERLVVLNRRPMQSRGRAVGWVTTLRDRTELSTLESELGATRTTTDTLRAQTHEFANQLHTISGLLQLGEYDEALGFVDGVSFSRTQLVDDVTQGIADPAIAALVIAKSSLAGERGVSIHLAPGCTLGKVDEVLSRDLVTVVGNLVDNALDAVAGLPDGTVELGLADDDNLVIVTVRDSGPGVEASGRDRIFEQGYSSKASVSSAGRGFGLALTRLVCERRGGSASVHNDGGAVFTAVLPREVAQ